MNPEPRKYMLKIAIPNKGNLSEGAVRLLKEAGYKAKRHGRELMVYDKENNIEFIFLRPKDIAIYVAKGVLDLGITGKDLALDSEANVNELLPLNFGKSAFCYSVPNEKNLTPNDFDGLRIATSYPNIVKNDMKQRSLNVETIKLDGAVEISIRLGVADAIADVVESGRTLKEAGLKVVGEPVMKSEAVLIAHSDETEQLPDVKTLVARIKGVLVARKYAIIEYDIPKNIVEKACELTPGIEAPTIAPLSHENWVAVKAMAKISEINFLMDKLKNIGAKGIIVTSIKSCRL